MISFITDDQTSTSYAKLYVSEGALSVNGSQYNVLNIRPVAQSLINDTDSFQKHPEKIEKLFGKRSLTSGQFIRTAIFNLSSDCCSFKKPMNLSIEVDVLLGSSAFDYCLAVLSKQRWECVARPLVTAENINDTKMNFLISGSGVYAVIYNPDDDHVFSNANVSGASNCDWWCENKGTVLGVLVGFIASILVLGLAVYGYLKFSRKEAKGDRLLSEQDERKIEDLNKQLSQKDKIIQETTQECNNSKEQNIKLTHEIENLQAEIEKIKAGAA
jgi:hypothetical protein